MRCAKSLGGHIKYISYGGAAMPPRIMRFFELIGIPLIGSYGSTECGGVTLCGVGENRPGNLGKPFANVKIKIADDSEILVRGPTVTPGYLRTRRQRARLWTRMAGFTAAISARSKTMVRLESSAARKMFLTASRDRISIPGFIELQLENEPSIRQAILLGDRRPFVAALIVPERRKIAVALAKQESSLPNDEIVAALWPRSNASTGGLNITSKIREIAVMQEDFPVEVAVNVFGKVKVDRAAAAERYAKEIQAIYASPLRGEVH